MPKLEVRLSEERIENSREDNDDEREQANPPLSNFLSNLNLFHCRPDVQFQGPATRRRASSKLALNGSARFLNVYSNGPEAEAFRTSVCGTFQFVTNVTTYDCSGYFGTGIGGIESTDTDQRSTATGWHVPLSSPSEGGDTLPLPSCANNTAQSGCMSSLSDSSEPSQPSSAEVSVWTQSQASSDMQMELSSSSLLIPSSRRLHSPVANADPARSPLEQPAASLPAHGGSLIHTEQQAVEIPAQSQEEDLVEDGEEVFDGVGPQRGGVNEELVLLPPVESRLRPLVLPIQGRRHMSV